MVRSPVVKVTGLVAQLRHRIQSMISLAQQLGTETITGSLTTRNKRKPEQNRNEKRELR